MTVSGLATRMRCELAELARKFHVPDPVPVIIPPTPPPMGDLIVEGLATTRGVPLDRVAVRGWAIPILPWQQDNPKVRLLFKHDTPAGVIERIEHDELGQLRVRARVTCPYAKTCGGLSVSIKVLDYELRNTDRPDFFALVKIAELDEISMTHQPADPAALVLRRSTPSSLDASFAKTIASVERLEAMVAALPPDLFAAAAPPPPPKRWRPKREMTDSEHARWMRINERFAAKQSGAASRGEFGALVNHFRSLEA